MAFSCKTGSINREPWAGALRVLLWVTSLGFLLGCHSCSASFHCEFILLSSFSLWFPPSRCPGHLIGTITAVNVSVPHINRLGVKDGGRWGGGEDRKGRGRPSDAEVWPCRTPVQGHMQRGEGEINSVVHRVTLFHISPPTLWISLWMKSREMWGWPCYIIAGCE